MNLASRGSTSGRPRGFASIFALFLIVVVTTAMVTLTSLMQTDARRTTSGSVDAQLRQLLHAGAVEAMRHVSDAHVAEARVTKPVLPEELVRQGATLQIELKPSSKGIEAAIHAGFGDRAAAQSIVLDNAGERGSLRAVELR